MSEASGKTTAAANSTNSTTTTAAATAPATPLRRLGVELQGRIDDYVARADAAVGRRRPLPEQRRNASVSLRNQIMSKLSARATADRAVTAADVEAVLAELGPADSPERLEAMGLAPAAPVHHRPPRLSLTALAGGIWAPLFFVMLVLSAVQLELKPGQTAPFWQRPVQLVIIPLGWAAPFATTVLGLLALGNIQRSNGTQYGLSLALFDALLFPLLLLDFLVFWLCWQIGNAMVAGETISVGMSNLIFHQAIPTIVCVLGDYYLVTRSWAAVQPEPPTGR